MSHWWGRTLGLENVASIDSLRLSLAAPWAEGSSAFWVVLLAVLALLAGMVFYGRGQRTASRGSRVLFGLCRGLVLLMLVVTLADPVLELGIVNRQRPVIAVVFDCTESMAIVDNYSPDLRRKIDAAIGETASGTAQRSRIDDVKALLRREQTNLVGQLSRQEVDLEAFIFDGNTTSRLRKLAVSGASANYDVALPPADELANRGQVTALGAVLAQLKEQLPARLAGVVLVSDFAHNSGPAPLGEPGHSPAAALGVPLYAVGVGATDAIDLAVELQTDLKMKKAERGSILVKLRQSGLSGQTAPVRVSARRLNGAVAAATGTLIDVGQRSVELSAELQTVEFPFVPEEPGQFEFMAEVQPLAGEASEQNNRSERQVNIIDDYLRLMYVAYEPTWEWRFIKEVFHRDKLVGLAGFRTFLMSSDPQVRESNTLFLPTLTPKRSDFFASDVLFLDDMPHEALTTRFSDLVKEFVGNLGGGLVVIAGPKFGPRELYNTGIADMLPVIIDPRATMQTAPQKPEFVLRLTPPAARYPFMQLSGPAATSTGGWKTLGKLPWYQPSAMPHPQADVLAEHPSDVCADGRTPQPLIAIRKYGKGEVVYLAFNEIWRLRKEQGEHYYRQFWSQLIYRLGMSHALGADKRFVVRLDEQQYRPDDKVRVSIEAYNENYEPLEFGAGSAQGLKGELISPGEGGTVSESFAIPQIASGLFETQLPVSAIGAHAVRVQDPVTGKATEQRFEVIGVSIERRRSVRDQRLQEALAEATGGRTYDLTTVGQLPRDLRIAPVEQRLTRRLALWSTPLWFGMVVVLLLGEWATRKWMRLA